MVQALEKRLVLIDDGDVGYLVDLVEAFNTVLDELSQVQGGLHSVRHALDDDGVVLGLTTLKQLPSSLEVSADADTSLNSDLVGRKSILILQDSAVSFHCCVSLVG